MAEEMKNGAISEEALEQVAGGLSISSSTLKKILIGAGVAILVAGGATTMGVGYKKGWFSKKGKRPVEADVEVEAVDPRNPKYFTSNVEVDYDGTIFYDPNIEYPDE